MPAKKSVSRKSLPSKSPRLAVAQPATSANPGLKLFFSFVSMFLVNAAVIGIANSWRPDLVVLGTMSLSYLPALLLSSGVLTTIGTFAIPFFHEIELQRGKMLTNSEWMFGYFLLNAASLWLIARAADVLGLGLASWLVVIALAVVVDVAQGLAMMSLEKVT